MAVLDASALLAWIYAENGHEYVADYLDNGIISAVNWSEVQQKIAAKGGDADQLGEMVLALGTRVVPFDPADARETALLYPHTRRNGLSQADRACLTLATREQVPAITTDRAWVDIDTGITVQLVR